MSGRWVNDYPEGAYFTGRVLCVSWLFHVISNCVSEKTLSFAVALVVVASLLFLFLFMRLLFNHPFWAASCCSYLLFCGKLRHSNQLMMKMPIYKRFISDGHVNPQEQSCLYWVCVYMFVRVRERDIPHNQRPVSWLDPKKRQTTCPLISLLGAIAVNISQATPLRPKSCRYAASIEAASAAWLLDKILAVTTSFMLFFHIYIHNRLRNKKRHLNDSDHFSYHGDSIIFAGALSMARAAGYDAYIQP